MGFTSIVMIYRIGKNLEDGQVLEGLGEFEGFARIGRSESIGRIGRIFRICRSEGTVRSGTYWKGSRDCKD